MQYLYRYVLYDFFLLSEINYINFYENEIQLFFDFTLNSQNIKNTKKIFK